jgi:hypothetical protein
MELTWLMRFRIAAAMAIGIIIIGILAWPLVTPAVPRGAVTLYAGDISLIDAVVCALLAVLSGFLAYFAAWPYGAEIAPLAAPTGIAIWAVKSGTMASLLRINTALTVNDTIDKRQALYAVLKWESIFWLALVAAGYLGVRLAARFFKATRPAPENQIDKSNSHSALAIATALLATVVVAYFAMGIFAQDVRMFDSELQKVVGQPGTAQIAFALIVSFAAAAFIAKRFLEVSYIFPVIAACALGFYAMSIAQKSDVLEHMIVTWPEAFFAKSVSAVLPVQLVSFAAIGSVTGYWIANKYSYWRQHGE